MTLSLERTGFEIDPAEKGREDEVQPNLEREFPGAIGGVTRSVQKVPMLAMRVDLAQRILTALSAIDSERGKLELGVAIEQFYRALADTYDLLDQSSEDAFLSLVAEIEDATKDLTPPEYTAERVAFLRQIFRLAADRTNLDAHYQRARDILDESGLEPAAMIDSRIVEPGWFEEEE
jgi:hypothetical protein